MLDVDPDRPEKTVLDAQEQHWQAAFVYKPEIFGGDPSGPAIWAAERFKEEGKRRLLELGCGQGRDTLFFAGSGRHITATDYSQSALDAVTAKARSTGLSARIDTRRHDVRDPLPFPDSSFEGCYSHMLYCMALTTVELEGAMGIAGGLWRVAEALFRRPEGGHSVRTGVFHALFSTAARWHSWPCCRRPFALPRLLGSSGRAGTGCLSAIVHANPGRRAGAVRKEPNTPTGRSAVTPAASLLGLAIAQATGAARAREAPIESGPPSM